MIVVDSNVIAYLYIPGENTQVAEAVLQSDPQWTAPSLWRSEMRNILALYVRRQHMTLDQAIQTMSAAEAQMQSNEFDVTSHAILMTADEGNISAHDAEFVALAKALAVPLISWDQRLKKAFPTVVKSGEEFLGQV